MLILGVSGSLRRGSHNTALLCAAARVLPAGVDLVRFGTLADLPPFDEDHDNEPAVASVRRLRDAIRSADALLIATPEYNASIPGQLKNALDWASRPFATNGLRGKPVAVIGAVWAQAELRKVLRTIGARVVERELAIAAAPAAFDPAGPLLHRSVRDSLSEIVHQLVDEAQESRSGLAA